MRFYTVDIKGKQEILVGFQQEDAVYRLSLLARLVPELATDDMNELICRYTSSAKEKLERLAENEDVLQGAAVKLALVSIMMHMLRKQAVFPVKPLVVSVPIRFIFPSV